MYVSLASLAIALLPLASAADANNAVAGAADLAGLAGSEWRTLSGHQVFVDTRGPGHVQMGYLSALHSNYPDPDTASGQPEITPEMCMRACESLGPNLCGAAQFFACSGVTSWCNLLTPAEYADALAAPLPVVDTEEVVGYAFERVRRPTKPKPSPALRH